MAMTASEFKSQVGHTRRETGERGRVFSICDCCTCVLCLAQENSTHYHFHMVAEPACLEKFVLCVWSVVMATTEAIGAALTH